ncbi:MAG: DEAD/DEAH box helicase [Fimbriimonadaceae bacterium]|nr:DEAD/DEAH box helicase [Fimbriimonadaceae bacterium]
MTSFESLGLHEALLRNVAAAGYETPTPIQVQAIPPLLEGRDLLGCAQTGTGKTAAFCLPLLQRLLHTAKPNRRACVGLILTPTRELAAQIGDNLAVYSRGLQVSHTLVYGGVGYAPQIKSLQPGCDLVVATPGRLLDLLRQRMIRLDQVEFLVLDEADRMLDMGFIHDIRAVLAALPEQRQTMFFSATMAGGAEQLAQSILHDPVQVAVAPSATPIELVEQRLMFVDPANKRALLGELLRDESVERALVFTRTKHGASRLARAMIHVGKGVEAIHGGMTQSARTRALQDFRDGKIRVLVATDVAGRGLDVEGISHVYNYDLPQEPEAYVHRIGRTGRAGAGGVAVSFCSFEEFDDLRGIERLIQTQITVVEEQPYHADHLHGMMRRPANRPSIRGSQPTNRFTRRRAFGR